MRKNLALAVVCLTLALAAVGCAPKKAEEAVTPEPTADTTQMTQDTTTMAPVDTTVQQ